MERTMTLDTTRRYAWKAAMVVGAVVALTVTGCGGDGTAAKDDKATGTGETASVGARASLLDRLLLLERQRAVVVDVARARRELGLPATAVPSQNGSTATERRWYKLMVVALPGLDGRSGALSP